MSHIKLSHINILPLAVVLFFISGCCTPDANVGSQNMVSTDQHQSNWCWAASGEMTMEFLGATIDQCDEANKEFGRTDCCNTPTPSVCNDGGWPEFDKYGFKADHTTDAALSWDEVKRQIYCHKVPFCNTWHWSGGGGHMMVISAYSVINGVSYVYLRDPLPVGTGSSRWITYDAYVSGSGYTHWDDYYNIAKK
ncbi:MAG TPA: papain-like cysteine protease family protein [Chitinophagales bacterium]|nr:papain-like cysteine protease family protein [Chitinophagales bacterium]